MEKLYNIIISLENLEQLLKIELRNLFKNYDCEFRLDNTVNIKNSDDKLIEQLEIWDIKIEENI